MSKGLKPVKKKSGVLIRVVKFSAPKLQYSDCHKKFDT